MRCTNLHPLLRNLQKNHTIEPNTKLVIDGKTFKKYNMYKDSGCQYILGGEYDRYADHLKKHFKRFKDLDITCYVVASSSATTPIDRRLEVHQKIIDQNNSIDPNKEDNIFKDPIFMTRVFKEVLDELSMEVITCESNSVVEMVNLAKYYKCPLLTRSVDLSLVGVPCISPRSINFEDYRVISCKLYDPEVCKGRIALNQDKLSIFLTLLDDDSDYLQDLVQLIRFRENNLLYTVHRYMKRQTRDTVLSDFEKHMTKTRYDMFLKDYNKIRDSMFKRQPILRLQYLKNQAMESEDWFVKGVMTGKIAACYVNLKKIGLFSGSWLISDNSKEDPMLPSMNIVRFAYELLSNFQSAKITFVGRVGDQSKTWEIFDSIGFERAKGTFGDVFKDGWSSNALPDYFTYFAQVELPGFDFEALTIIPEDCRLLMMALVYYIVKIDGDNRPLVYSVILSFIMLGPVTKVTGILKKSNFNLMQDEANHSDVANEDGLVEKDCFVAAKALIDYFYANDLANIFDRGVLHMFAEFQHCLQQLNYLNNLCGQRVKCTVYHKCYNATFIYNIFLEIQHQMEPKAKIEGMLKGSPTVLEYFQKFVQVFEHCVDSIKK